MSSQFTASRVLFSLGLRLRHPLDMAGNTSVFSTTEFTQQHLRRTSLSNLTDLLVGSASGECDMPVQTAVSV
jgi:hypothetical protein